MKTIQSKADLPEDLEDFLCYLMNLVPDHKEDQYFQLLLNLYFMKTDIVKN